MSLVEKALHKMRSATSRDAGRAGDPRPGVAVNVGRSSGRSSIGQEALGNPNRSVIGIDRESLVAQGLLAPLEAERGIAEQFRQIRRPLLAKALGRGVPRLDKGQLIMVASALPGEGKSFFTLNLALSMARQRDLRVLMVDADACKAQISRVLGAGEEPGLLDLLRTPNLDPESLIAPTSVPGLSVLPAGVGGESARELFATSYMRELMCSLVERDANRIVVLDSSPLLRTTESHALAHAVGQIVVVVRAAATQRKLLLDALSYLGQEPTVSLVLNQSTSDTSTGYYYQEYGERTSEPPNP